jgi:predicted XRE-type DNA-binding protein
VKIVVGVTNYIGKRKRVRPYIESEVIDQTDAARIIDWSQPTISVRLETDPEDGWDKRVPLDRQAVLDLVREDSLNQTQAAEILDITPSAVSQALD